MADTKNKTYANLEGLPFKSATEMKKLKNEIELNTWKGLKQAQSINELTKRQEFDFWNEEFKAGLSCAYADEESSLIRVFSDGPGVKISINQEMVDTVPSGENLIGVLIKSMSESFLNTYYKAKGMMPTDPEKFVKQIKKGNK